MEPEGADDVSIPLAHFGSFGFEAGAHLDAIAIIASL